MTGHEFQSNDVGAEILKQLADDPRKQNFWAGYLRGIRRNYYGETFGTDEEHETWMALADDRQDIGDGYRAGVHGVSVQDALKDRGRDRQPIRMALELPLI